MSPANLMAQVERLQKILAHWGVASRRHAEDLIRAGEVRINGKVAQLGDKVDPERDQIELKGRILGQTSSQSQQQTWLLHKPKGVVSTCDDPWGRPTVVDLIRTSERLYPIGRLDTETTGALLLTNDGDLTLQLTHPRYHLPKTYWVQVQGSPRPDILQQWREGVSLEDGLTQPAQVDYWDPCSQVTQTRCSETQATTWLQVILTEGRNRQIRRVAKTLGYPVLVLHRVAIGSVYLHDLGLGQSRLLSPTELYRLKNESRIDHVS